MPGRAPELRCCPAIFHGNLLQGAVFEAEGQHIIKICNGTACHIRGSVNLATGLKSELGIDPGETTEDGMFSVEMVNCLGSCALAPVMLVDGTYHNKLKLEDVPGIVERYRLADAEEGEAGND